MNINSGREVTGLQAFAVFLVTLAIITSSAGNSHGEMISVGDYKIHLHAGDIDSTIAFFKEQDFWGAKKHDEDLDVPRIILAVTTKTWSKKAAEIDVPTKKELFYRVILPLVLLSNQLIEQEREMVQAMAKQLDAGSELSSDERIDLDTLVQSYRIDTDLTPKAQVEELLMRVDTIPASLALGQAAYESGYGTSRFAEEGNALFGQWTFGGKGMKPGKHRAEKGDYGVASFRWPFDSVRSYMRNLNSHKAYKQLRDKRASIRVGGDQATGIQLSETLESYSEKGLEYVNTLQSIINKNNLAIADNAYLRDEPTILTVGAGDEQKLAEAKSVVEQLRSSGELERIIAEMQLE